MRAVIKGGRGAKDLIGRLGGFGEHHSNSHSHSTAESVPESDSTSFASEAGGGKTLEETP